MTGKRFCIVSFTLYWRSAGAPSALLQSCLTFGAFSFIIEGMNKQQPAMAHQVSLRNTSAHGNPLSSLACPLPKELMAAFTSFSESLNSSGNGPFPFSTWSCYIVLTLLVLRLPSELWCFAFSVYFTGQAF